MTVTSDFLLGTHGWEAGFADYSLLNEHMELEAGLAAVPPELGTGTAFYIAGHNRSDDLFMFLTKKLSALDGITPNQRYELSYRIVFASQAGTGCAGIGGAPGEAVALKAGGSGFEPKVVLDEHNHYRMNIDKGDQSVGGEHASVAGTIANGTDNCSGDAPFVWIGRTHKHTHTVTSSPRGELWLIVGSDSGFEGKTRLYYRHIDVTATPVP